MSKHEAMVKYLMQYPPLQQSFLYFNTAANVAGNISVQTVYSDEWEEQDITGHGTKRYDFAIIFMAPQDSGTSLNNVNRMEDAQAFMDWIREQDEKQNYPNFWPCEVYSIENLQNMPNLATANERVAKYMFQCRVRYYE